MGKGSALVSLVDYSVANISGALSTMATSFQMSGAYMISNLDKQVLVAGVQFQD